jgi:hypothetical protein
VHSDIVHQLKPKYTSRSTDVPEVLIPRKMDRLIDGARSIPGEGDEVILTRPWWVGKLRGAVGSSSRIEVSMKR